MRKCPRINKHAKTPIFKNTTLDFDEKMMVIKQQLCDEDEAPNSTQSEPKEPERNKSKTKARAKFTENEPINKESVKNETPTATKKKRQNKNGKLAIDKRNNYAYVPNAPRKLCQNWGSSNHLTLACNCFRRTKIYLQI